MAYDPYLQGRSYEDQVEDIRRHSHSTWTMERDMIFGSFGIKKMPGKSENVIMLGCYSPFYSTPLLKDYFALLERLGIDYTWLERETCCGLPLIEQKRHAGVEEPLRLSKEFQQLNVDRAREVGGKRFYYWCIWCAHLAKKAFPEEADAHRYFADILVEGLEGERLEVPPMVVGYYEGCHSRYADFLGDTDTTLNWPDYRRLLDRVVGLKVVSLPDNICCTITPERIIEAAIDKKVDAIVTPCIGCWVRERRTAQGRIEIKYITEILLRALEGGRKSEKQQIGAPSGLKT